MLREICVPALIKEFLFKVIPLIFQCICETMRTVVRHRNAISSDDSNGSTRNYRACVMLFFFKINMILHQPSTIQQSIQSALMTKSQYIFTECVWSLKMMQFVHKENLFVYNLKLHELI